MNISRFDLNLLIYFDVLLREKNVTRAAHQLGITQPAMSNGLRRLRELLEDPILVRTSDGMAPTERALELQPTVREVLAAVEKAIQPQQPFDAPSSQRVFRIAASDYAESTLIPKLLTRIRQHAPDVILDVLTPSDVTFSDIEQGRVDMAINRFDQLPQSFHQKTVWQDSFSCVVSRHNPILDDFTLDRYLAAQHIWVSKTGFGIGVGVNPKDVQRLGWVDEALDRLGKKRHITVFTRHYQVAMLLAQQPDLIVTLPTRAARLEASNPELVEQAPPFAIPSFELKLAWSPLLQHNAGHQWLRKLIAEVAEEDKTPVQPEAVIP